MCTFMQTHFFFLPFVCHCHFIQIRIISMRIESTKTESTSPINLSIQINTKQQQQQKNIYTENQLKIQQTQPEQRHIYKHTIYYAMDFILELGINIHKRNITHTPTHIYIIYNIKHTSHNSMRCEWNFFLFFCLFFNLNFCLFLFKICKYVIWYKNFYKTPTNHFWKFNFWNFTITREHTVLYTNTQNLHTFIYNLRIRVV